MKRVVITGAGTINALAHDVKGTFAALAEDMLLRAEVPWRRIGGSWAEREAQVRAVIAEALPVNGGSPARA